MKYSIKSKYLSSAAMLIFASVLVKIISAIYKIPLTSFIGATGRGYFAIAYNIFMPIHIITMGSLPIALSGLVSKYNAQNDRLMIFALKKSANRIFLLVGIASSLIILIFCVPYCALIAKSPNSILTVYMIIPVALFSTLSASYRGYFEGFMNMTPTSISQLIDVVIKALFGMLLAKFSMAYLYDAYINKSLFLFESIANDSEALSIIYPITTAFAMLGVSLGSIVSYLYLVVYYKKHCSYNYKLPKNKISVASKLLFDFGGAIMLSTIVQSIFQFLDTASVQLALTSLTIDEIKLAFSDSLVYAKINESDLYTYSYGIFSSALDFKNIIPGITMAIGICGVPAISGAFSSNNKYRLNLLSNSAFKYTTMLSTCCGTFLAMESYNILGVFYSKNQDIIVGCDNLVKLFGYTIFAYCFSGISIFCLQAIGKPKECIMPFIIGGVIRAVLNILLVSNPTLNIYGSAISGFVGFMIIGVLNTKAFIKYSCVNLSIKNSFFKPIIVVIFTYFMYDTILKYLNCCANSLLFLIIKGAIFMVIYLLLAIFFNVLDKKDLKKAIICKNHS